MRQLDANKKKYVFAFSIELFEGGGGALPEYASREGCGVRVPDSRKAASRHLECLGGDSKNQVLNREFASVAAHNTFSFGCARQRACGIVSGISFFGFRSKFKKT